jgi:hypothetical protein
MFKLARRGVRGHLKLSNIANILASVRRNNAARGVAGLLYFNQHYFLQCLEGSRSAVNQSYHKILRDDRHTMPMLLEYQEIAERSFSTCEMRYLPATETTEVLYTKF